MNNTPTYHPAVTEWKRLCQIGGTLGMDENDIPWSSTMVIRRAFVRGTVLDREDVAAAREAYIAALEAEGFWHL